MPVEWYESRKVKREALQYTGENFEEVAEWVRFNGGGLRHEGSTVELFVKANTDWLKIEGSEWVIRDSEGFYPCKDSMFREKYSIVTVDEVVTHTGDTLNKVYTGVYSLGYSPKQAQAIVSAIMSEGIVFRETV